MKISNKIFANENNTNYGSSLLQLTRLGTDTLSGLAYLVFFFFFGVVHIGVPEHLPGWNGLPRFGIGRRKGKPSFELSWGKFMFAHTV